VREEQEKNILLIFVAEDVSKPLRFKDVKEEQSRNILLILGTEDVSAVPTTNDVMFKQPKNALFNRNQPTSPRSSTDLTFSLSPPLLK
jgi:hypothetical protein